MERRVQKRSLETRAKLIAAARDVIGAKGYGAMRVEEVVQQAGVAKGTFFAHFRDKDALMDLIIGEEIDKHLDAIEQLPSPDELDRLIDHLMPLMQFMTCERYVFDVIIRHSGSTAKEEIGPIAQTFGRLHQVCEQWLADSPVRKDVSASILSEGLQAFAIQCMALHFCAIHSQMPMRNRFRVYMEAWLLLGRETQD